MRACELEAESHDRSDSVCIFRKCHRPSIKGCENVLASVEKSHTPAGDRTQNAIFERTQTAGRQICEACALSGGSVRRFVHTSSCIAVAAVDTKQGARYDEADLNEWSTLETDAYGYAKSAAEQLVRKRCAQAAPLPIVCADVCVCDTRR